MVASGGFWLAFAVLCEVRLGEGAWES